MSSQVNLMEIGNSKKIAVDHGIRQSERVPLIALFLPNNQCKSRESACKNSSRISHSILSCLQPTMTQVK